VWDVEVFSRDAATAPKIHSKNGHASPTPLVEGQRLYVHFGHQGTACLDLSGKIVWRNDSIKYPPVHGGGGSPILVDDRLIYSCDGAEAPFVVALDRTKGKVAWKTKRDNDPARMLDPPKKFAFSTPLAISVGGKTQVVVPGAGAVMAYDPASGGEIWRVRYDGYSVVPRPVFGHGMVYISTGFDAPVVLAIRPDGRGDVTETHVAWKQAKGAPNTPSLLLVGDELYMVADRGVATCADARTGQIHWQQRVPETYSASPFAAEGRLYLLSEKGTGVVLRCGKKFEQLAANALDERSLASCAVADGALYVRTEKHLFRIRRPPLDDKTSKR
jgi:outer membrane protein assembly factor BamB